VQYAILINTWNYVVRNYGTSLLNVPNMSCSDSCNNPQTRHFPTPPDPAMLRARSIHLRSLTVRISASRSLSRTSGAKGDT
jgi:hypothetical protein